MEQKRERVLEVLCKQGISKAIQIARDKPEDAPFPKKNLVPLAVVYLFDIVLRVLDNTAGPQKNYANQSVRVL